MIIPTIRNRNTTVQFPHTIYAEMTPNPVAMKFVLNSLLMKEAGKSVEFRTKKSRSVTISKKTIRLPLCQRSFHHL